MKRFFSGLVYLATVFLSWKYCAGYWVVGAVFAAACLLLQYKKIKKEFSARHLLFIAASVLTYALVYWVADKGWRFKPEIADMLFGSFTAGIVLGSILLPVLHGMIFSVELKKIRKIGILLIASWYGVLMLSHIDEVFNIPGRVDYTLVAIALWQGIYLRYLKVH